MEERRQFILKAIIHSYIASGEPVGSRTLQREYQMEVSPATIRNEMSDLEYAGYLTKAHTSSGRIPSNKGYRWYVDQLFEMGFDEDAIPALSESSLLLQSNAFDNILSRALEVLTDASGLVSLAMIPGRAEDVLTKIELIPVTAHEVVIVSIFHSKVIKSDFVHLSQDYSEQRLERTRLVLQDLLQGKTLAEMSQILDSDSFSGDFIYGNLTSEIFPALRRQVEENLHPRLVFRGLNKLYQSPDLSATIDNSDLIQWLQHDPEALRIFPDHKGEPGKVQVRIGEELPGEAFNEAALVFVPFGIRGPSYGYLGLLGPNRMDYARAVKSVAIIGRYINSITTRS